MAISSPKKRRVLSVFSLVMINVIAVDSLRTLPIGAEFGFSLVFFYLLGGLCFFLPTALVAAELATTWPSTGGVYVWVREAFGLRTSFLAIWLQWLYNVVWYPTIMAFLAATLAFLINPILTENKYFLLVTVLILFWGSTLINCYGMKTSSIVSAFGAIIGTIIPMLLIIALGALWLYNGNLTELEFTWQQFFPDIRQIGNLSFFAGILFGLMGLEMSAVHAEEVRNPQKDFPRALVYSVLIIITTLTLSSLAIAIVVPHSELHLVTGLIQFFQAYQLDWMTPIVAILIIIGGFSSVSAWVIGPTKGLLAAARDGSIPPLFQKVNRHGAPINILITQGLIFTALCSVFLLMPTINSSYWILTALTSQLALLFYILFFSAAIRLRFSQSKKKRPYRIPGGNWGICIVSGVGITACLVVTTLGFFPPTDIDVGNIFIYESLLTGGLIIFTLPPFIIFSCRKSHWIKQ